MTIDSGDAASALGEIDAITRKVRQSVFYRRASLSLLLWGALVFLGYVVTFAAPRQSTHAWTIVYVAGVTGSAAIGALNRSDARGGLDWRLISAFALFLGFGLLCTLTFGGFGPRELSAFWPIYFMLPFTIVGLWAARGFVVMGAAVSALALFGYFFVGGWFDLWMAFVNGGGLVFAGLWMRRA